MKKNLFLAISTIGVAAAVGAIFWHQEDLRIWLQRYIENGEFLTLEARYPPESIMEAQRLALLGTSSTRTFHRAVMKYHPYMMLEVKYTLPEKKTHEGIVLWSLVDGEILMDTDSWERTHGYYDAIIRKASKNDFKILYALARNGGALTLEQLQRELRVDEDALELLAASAKAKQLVTQKGNALQLHFQDPKLLVVPKTALGQSLVTKPYSQAQRLGRHFTAAQIEQTAKAAFGSDFAVRSTHEVLLPFYAIEVLNSDGSLMTSYWNALTGERIPAHIL